MPTQTVSFEIDCQAELTADSVRDSYGVPGSDFWSIDNIDWADSTIDICGVTVRLKELPKDLQIALWDCANDGIDDAMWRNEDE